MKICEVCFLDHDIEECKAIMTLQVLLARGNAQHIAYTSVGMGYRVEGGSYIVSGLISRETDRLQPEIQMCSMKFLKYCHNFFSFGDQYLPKEWINYAISGRHTYAYKWLLARYRHLVFKEAGERTINKAYRLGFKNVLGKEWYDSYEDFNYSYWENE